MIPKVCRKVWRNGHPSPATLTDVISEIWKLDTSGNQTTQTSLVRPTNLRCPRKTTRKCPKKHFHTTAFEFQVKLIYSFKRYKYYFNEWPNRLLIYSNRKLGYTSMKNMSRERQIFRIN